MAIEFSRKKEVPRGRYDGKYGEVRLVNSGLNPNVQQVAEESVDPWSSPNVEGDVVDSTAVRTAIAAPAQTTVVLPDGDDVARAYQVVQSGVEQVPSSVMLWAQAGFFVYLATRKELPLWARGLAGLLGARLVMRNFKIQPALPSGVVSVS